MSHWKLSSIPPHDWTLCLDMSGYFDHEHILDEVPEKGFIRPLWVGDRDIVVTVFFNGDPDQPEFHIQSAEALSKDEIYHANLQLSRMFGADLDLRPLYDQAAKDPVLGPLLEEHYGFKRMTRATLFEDIVNRIVEMQMAHKPTARKMMYAIRETYGATVQHDGKPLAAWPKPIQLMGADPARIRTLGPTVRKGEYIAGLAADIVGGNLDIEWLDRDATPAEFLEGISGVRGIGPVASQELMLYRPRTDAIFPSNQTKGEETGLRKWILLSYGKNPNKTSDREFQNVISSWKGYEAAAIEFLYMNYVMTEKKRRFEKKNLT